MLKILLYEGKTAKKNENLALNWRKLPKREKQPNRFRTIRSDLTRKAVTRNVLSCYDGRDHVTSPFYVRAGSDSCAAAGT